jgi:hypothetical protein
MDKPPVISKKLILKGIYPDDFAQNESIYEKVPQQTQNTEKIIVYTEIPRKFTSVKDWPQFSNLKCWTCDLIPNGYPRFIPENLEKDAEGNDICDARGNFHEWNCAVRYVLTEFPKELQWDTLQAICLFESKFSGRRREKIMPSPSKVSMKEYCGSAGLTQKQYREKINTINAEYDLTTYQMEHL